MYINYHIWLVYVVYAAAIRSAQSFLLNSPLRSTLLGQQSLFVVNSSRDVDGSIGSSIRRKIAPFLPIIAWYSLANLPIYGIGEWHGKADGLGAMTDFATLENRIPPPAIANEYIVAPRGVAPRARVVAAPTFDVPAEKLYAIVDEVVMRQSFISSIQKDPATMRQEYVQRTPIFRFPDVITVRTIPIDEKTSSIAVHSYSIYGAGDLGVNANRVKQFLNEISLATRQ